MRYERVGTAGEDERLGTVSGLTEQGARKLRECSKQQTQIPAGGRGEAQAFEGPFTRLPHPQLQQRSRSSPQRVELKVCNFEEEKKV